MEQMLPTGELITLVHFVQELLLPPLEQEGPPKVRERIACMPNMTEFHQTLYHPNYQRTNDVRAVSCPACKKSQQFKDALKALA